MRFESQVKSRQGWSQVKATLHWIGSLNGPLHALLDRAASHLVESRWCQLSDHGSTWLGLTLTRCDFTSLRNAVFDPPATDTRLASGEHATSPSGSDKGNSRGGRSARPPPAALQSRHMRRPCRRGCGCSAASPCSSLSVWRVSAARCAGVATPLWPSMRRPRSQLRWRSACFCQAPREHRPQKRATKIVLCTGFTKLPVLFFTEGPHRQRARSSV